MFNVQGNPPYCNDPSVPVGACIPLSNDFLQYYLGSYSNNSLRTEKADLDGVTIDFFDPMEAPTATLNGAGSADNQSHAYTLTPTSTVLPADEYPLFKSQEVGDYSINGPLAPRTGDYYAFSQVADQAYKRLSRTVDLTGHTSGTLKFFTSYDTEPDYDYMFVEAHTVGQDDWTTLPDVNGNTSQELDPAAGSCADGWAAPDGQHPFLAHYMNPDTCAPTGTTGEWNATTGNSGGYQEWEVDLSDFAGSQVEVSISYATDPFVQGLGAFVDDTEVLVDGQPTDSTSFEDGLGGWTIGGPPAGSDPNLNNWIRTQALFEESAAVATADTLYYGFGLEGVQGAATRSAIMKSAMKYLGVLNPGGGPARARPRSGPRSWPR